MNIIDVGTRVKFRNSGTGGHTLNNVHYQSDKRKSIEVIDSGRLTTVNGKAKLSKPAHSEDIQSYMRSLAQNSTLHRSCNITVRIIKKKYRNLASCGKKDDLTTGILIDVCNCITIHADLNQE